MHRSYVTLNRKKLVYHRISTLNILRLQSNYTTETTSPSTAVVYSVDIM